MAPWDNYDFWNWLKEHDIVTENERLGGLVGARCTVCGKKEVDFEFPKHFRQRHNDIVKMYEMWEWK